ncbi:hypothetical protein [Halorarius litoreus]|uniref:hypothetical protein n=1 Tax=Halorarius litoreus TaxID=2962676 RepID=UPI0020CF557A|nr:hypothetical protein [Halorarius litoreus]
MFEFAQRIDAPRVLLPLGVLLMGVGLALTGVSVHVEATTCHNCTPYHPLFVVAPVGIGATLTTAGGWLLGRL